MENTCQDTQDLMPQLIEGSLSDKQAAQLQGHISQCPACCRRLQALRSDERLLSNFAEAMQPTVARIQNSVIQTLGGERLAKPVGYAHIYRTIIKSQAARFAIAASVIFLALLLSLLNLSKSGNAERETSPRYILGKAQQDHSKETRPWDILPPLPN